MEKLQKFRRYSKRMVNKLKKSDGDDVADWNFTTHINKEDLTISWNVENVSHCFFETGEYHESPTFCTGFSSEIKWTLRIYPKGRKYSGKVGIFICKSSENVRTEIKYLLQLKLISAEEKCEIYSCKSPSKSLATKDVNKESKEWGTDELIPSRYLLGKESFFIMCHWNVTYVEDGESFITGPSTSCTLRNDFKEMYKSGRFSDVLLVVGKKSFPAHKAILAARSKVFSAMFDHDMKEAKASEILIEDVEPSVMNSLLQYIYTGKVEELTVEKAVSLFPTADRYSLGELQQWCVSIMLANLSIDNVCHYAILADMHSEPKLKRACNFIFRKYQYEIFLKKEWKELCHNNPTLASDIVQAVSSDFHTSFPKP